VEKSGVQEAGGTQSIGMVSLKYLLIAARPKQWTKNALVFFGLIFSMNLFNPRMVALTVVGFVVFCAISSGVYLINDLADIQNDRRHPVKSRRPLASGKLRPSVAVGAASALLVGSLFISFRLNQAFGFVALGYVALNVAYSYGLKHIVLVDVFAIAGGFVLRAMAGAVIIAVPISPWLYACTVLGALFLGFGKRRHELILLEGKATTHRPILEEYTAPMLDQLITIVTATTIMAYSLYTFSAPNLPRNNAMMLTIPFVLYGAFRYLYLVHLKNAGGSPEEMLLKDKPLLFDVLLWVAASATILYAFKSA